MRKAVIIGLDSATLDIITPMVDDGRLPNLAGLMASGVSGTLLSTTPPVTPPAWVSFMTGKNPGKHGVFDFFGPPSAGYDRPLYHSSHIQTQTIWEMLSERGLNVGVVNLPMTDPPLPLNGFMVPGMQYGTIDGQLRTHPPELIQDIRKQIGDYRVVYGDLESLYSDRLDQLIQQWKKIVDLRRRAILHLMDSRPWDVFMAVFYVLDVVQHHFWKWHDASHPAFTPNLAARYGEVIAEFYQMVDAAVGDILSRVDENTPVLVVSDHGAGAEQTAFYLNTWLHRQGLLNFKPCLEPFRRLKLPHLLYMILNRLKVPLVEWTLNRGQLRSLGKAVDPREALRIPWFIDWPRTAAFAGNHTEQGIYINLKGREPNGIVARGPAYEQLRGRIIAGLQSLISPLDGKPLPVDVFKREELYHGPYLEAAPDILFVLENGKSIAQKEIHHPEVFGPATRTSGTHRREGLFIARGNGLQSNNAMDAAHITDMAPTLLYLLDQPVPDDMDGRVRMEWFTKDHVKQHQVVYTASSSHPAIKKELTSEEEQVMKQTLRDLGYL